jgi:sarcosine oxidase delta subunit
MNSWDTEGKALIVCPYCGHEYANSQEITESQEFQCDRCEEYFDLEVESYTMYTSTRREERGAERQ